MECLKNIIGITKSDCPCVTNGMTPEQKEEAQISTSGLYLSDLPGGVSLKALSGVDVCRKMFEMSKDAINNAIKTVESDILVAVNNRYKSAKKRYLGEIGRKSYTKSLSITKKIQGVFVSPVDDSDSTILLNGIKLILNQSIPIDIKIYRTPFGENNFEEIHSFSGNTIANSFANIAIPGGVILPSYHNNKKVQYLFAYEVPDLGVQPKDTDFSCSSCNGGKSGYYQFLSTKGIQVSSIGESFSFDNFAKGLVLEVEVYCDSPRLFCREYQNNDAIAVVLAYATWYKSGELLIEDVLKQPEINRYTTMAKEYLWGKRNHFRSEYESRINYLAQTMDVSSSDCYLCREQVNQPFVQGIRI